MKENLKTKKYRDGANIPNVTDNTTWANLSTGAYCEYNNNATNSDEYGLMYNFFVVSDSHIICPTGWHVPSDAEWTILSDFLGGSNIAGNKMKETGIIHWESPNSDATNTSGFTGLPGGSRVSYFSGIRLEGYWWSSTEFPTDNTLAWFRYLSSGSPDLFSGAGMGKAMGYSIRCVKDSKYKKTK